MREARFMLSCAQTARLISETQDRKLSLLPRLALRLHLSMCIMCFRYQKHLEFLRAAVRRHGKQHEQDSFTDVALQPEARRRIEALLKDE